MDQAFTNNLLPAQSNIYGSDHEMLILRKGLIVLSWLRLTGLDRLRGQYEDLGEIGAALIKYMLITVPVVSEPTWANT